MKLKKVEIHWLDHCSYSDQGWYHPETYNDLKPTVIKTVGYLLKETDDYVLVGLSVGKQRQVSGVFCIIKKCIVKRRKL